MKNFTLEELEYIAQRASSDPGNRSKRVDYLKAFSPDVIGVLLEIARRAGVGHIQVFEYIVPNAPETSAPKFDA